MATSTEVPNLFEALSRALRGEFDDAAKTELGAALGEAPTGAEVLGDLNDYPHILALLIFMHQLEKLNERLEAEHNHCHETEKDGERSPHHLALHVKLQNLESMLDVVRPLFWKIADQQFGTEDSDSAVHKGFKFIKSPPGRVQWKVFRLSLPGMIHGEPILPSGSDLPSGKSLWKRFLGRLRG